MFSQQANIFLYDAKKNDITNQMTDNTQDLRLKQKHSAAEISDIHQKFSSEEDLVRAKIDSLEGVNAENEYESLMAELKDLQDDEDREVEAAENMASVYENGIQLENDQLQSQLEAIVQDREGIEENLKENVEKTFGYFNK